LIGATPGAGGTDLAQAAWLPVFRALGAAVWPGGRLAVSNAAQAFAADGRLVDEALRVRVEKYIHGFAAFVARGAPRPPEQARVAVGSGEGLV
jgi:chromate reductase, NAD(P)H dehydrogenase (quinone)